MPTNQTPYNEPATPPLSVTDQVSEAASQMKDKVSDLGRTAADKIDANRETAASGLDSAASALRNRAGRLPGGEAVTDLALSSADKLSSTATYVRENDIDSMVADVQELVKKNPGPSLIVAAAIGFLIGRAVSND